MPSISPTFSRASGQLELRADRHPPKYTIVPNFSLVEWLARQPPVARDASLKAAEPGVPGEKALVSFGSIVTVEWYGRGGQGRVFRPRARGLQIFLHACTGGDEDQVRIAPLTVPSITRSDLLGLYPAAP